MLLPLPLIDPLFFVVAVAILLLLLLMLLILNYDESINDIDRC